jgi:hypothetical protein
MRFFRGLWLAESLREKERAIRVTFPDSPDWHACGVG